MKPNIMVSRNSFIISFYCVSSIVRTPLNTLISNCSFIPITILRKKIGRSLTFFKLKKLRKIEDLLKRSDYYWPVACGPWPI